MLRVPDVVVSSLCEPLWDLYERSVRLRTYRDLDRSQWFSRADLEGQRLARLRSLLTHAAASSPLHAHRLAAAGIDPAAVRGIEDLASLPLLTKADIRDATAEIVSSRYSRDDLVPAKTGGSTGEALRVYCDRAGVERRAAAALRADTWAGWRLGQPLAAVWGNPPRPGNWRSHLRRHLKDRRFYLDTMKITPAAVDRFVRDWRRWRPGLLYGHAHSLFILAEHLRERGETGLRPAGIVATSMMLLEPERRVIEQVFGTPVTNRYGCEEVSLIACECEVHQGMHINAEHCYVEFLRDDGSPCAPGEDGRIVVTELINRGMPMIRYEVGDRGAPADRSCPCGRGLPLMEGLSGRTADFLVAEDGSQVAGISLIENTLTRYGGIRQLQLVQEERGAIVANVVAGRGWGEETARALEQELRRHLGSGLRVQIRLLDEIPAERNGKYRFSICRIS
ncbi:MAG: phenylacetate--CoA ligase family protein [Candidatus Krumholzibacteriia bacterium]